MASGLTIVPVWDPSVLAAPNAAVIEGAFNAAAADLEAKIATPITVYIDVGWGEAGGTTFAAGTNFVARSRYFGSFVSYAEYRQALLAHATSVDDHMVANLLPTVDPTGGGEFFLTNALSNALGLYSYTSSAMHADGSVGLNTAVNWDFDPANRAVAGEHDAIGAFEHEITEVMGRSGSLGSVFSPAHTDVYGPLDLVRYTSVGGAVVPDLTPGPGSFSVDGHTLLLAFNDPTGNSGDAGDWANGLVGDSFGANYSGVASVVSDVDQRLMDVIGYDRPPATHVAGDFNADGHSDLLWRNVNNGAFTEWDIGGTGTGPDTEQANVYVNGSVGTDWQVQGAFDFNGDGASDILWRNVNSGAFTVWEGAGSGFLANADAGSNDLSWSVAGLGDFNGDHRDDVLWRNGAGALSVWQSTGAGFTPNVFTTQLDPSWHVVGVGDFNGDGRDDLLFRNVDGRLSEWQSTGTGFTADVYTTSSIGKDWHVAAVADFTGDGKADILFRNDDGNFTEWQSTGNGFTPNVYANTSVDDTWHIVGTGDFNDDGRADILWRNDAGVFTVWESTGSGFVANTLSDGSVHNDWAFVTHRYDYV